jgi:hypothetical protein
VTADIAKLATDACRPPAGTALDFLASGATLRPNRWRALGVEGGGGYRLLLRSDFDCLMRRIPATIAVSAAGATGGRCASTTCRSAGVAGGRAARRGQGLRGRSFAFDNPRIASDWAAWKTRESPAAGFDPAHNFNRILTMAVPADEPKWSKTISFATFCADGAASKQNNANAAPFLQQSRSARHSLRGAFR